MQFNTNDFGYSFQKSIISYGINNCIHNKSSNTGNINIDFIILL